MIFSILIFYGILVVVNLPAPLLDLEFDSKKSPLSFAPPGFVIPIIWFLLFTLLGIARESLVKSGAFGDQWLLFSLAFLCATYAYYTLGLAKITGISALWFGLVGNLVVIAFAGFVVVTLLPVSKVAALLTIPVIAWTAFATAIVVGEMRIAKLI